MRMRMAFIGWVAVMLVASGASAGEPLTLERLACMDCCELEQLYRQAPPGTITEGFAPGRAIYCSGTPLARTKSKITNAIWRGKHFDATQSMLTNQWCGLRAIKACVYRGDSWLDGGPSIVMDYRGTSRVWSTVRDEMREVAPGLFLGMMFEDRCCGPKFRMFFALETCQANCD
jgi:hypothetical protein